MIKESIKDLVLAIAEGNSIVIEDSFNSIMASKISDRLDSMRVDVAQGMFGSVDESYDSSDAYETWDPKHPKFKDKLIKHHAKGGTTQSFIDQEKAKAKKKLTREEVELEELTLEDYSVEELEDFMMSEDFEQLDELSKKTLGSYVKKATTSAIISGEALGKGEKWSKSGQIASKREKGIGKAVDKMTKESFDIEDYSVEELEDFMMSEEFEQLDELSKKTLGSYVKKAHDQLMKHTASVNFKSGRGDSDVLSYTHEPRTARKTANRTKGVATAVDKLAK